MVFNRDILLFVIPNKPRVWNNTYKKPTNSYNFIPEINVNIRIKNFRRQAEQIQSLLAEEDVKQRQTLAEDSGMNSADKFSTPELQYRYQLFRMHADEIRFILHRDIGLSISRIRGKMLNRRLQKIESELERLKCSN